MPALLHDTPEASLESLYLQNYEISPTEPLHDIKGHLSNVTDGLLSQTTGNIKKKLSSIYSSVLGKDTLRCCDYRKAAILILLALDELRADRKYIELMRTLGKLRRSCTPPTQSAHHKLFFGYTTHLLYMANSAQSYFIPRRP